MVQLNIICKLVLPARVKSVGRRMVSLLYLLGMSLGFIHRSHNFSLFSILVPASGLFVVGLIDDIRSVRAGIKLAAQVAGGAYLYFSGFRLLCLHNLSNNFGAVFCFSLTVWSRRAAFRPACVCCQHFWGNAVQSVDPSHILAWNQVAVDRLLSQYKPSFIVAPMQAGHDNVKPWLTNLLRDLTNRLR
jgi:UDP-N-acetylmuramyl pentapeptide phosphotransferase/UDP-N-acetylglucosamine-1-phosphate transferase